MTSSLHGPYALGHTHATMDGTIGCKSASWSKSNKAILSSDCMLKFACMKLELLVTVHQLGTVNTFSGIVHTARHVMKVGTT